MAYELLAQSRKLSKRAGPNKSGGGGWKGSENFLKKISGGRLLGTQEYATIGTKHICTQ